MQGKGFIVKTKETKKNKQVEPKLKILEFKDEQLEEDKEICIRGIAIMLRRFPIERLRELGHIALEAFGLEGEMEEGGVA